MAQWKRSMLALTLVSAAAVTSLCATAQDTRLADAVMRGNRATVDALLSEHVPVDGATGDGTTALHWAAYQADTALVKSLLAAHANVNAVTRLQAITPLYLACQTGNGPMVALLIDGGADVNQANTLGTTPLMVAAASGNADTVKLLLEHGADANATEKAHGQTALMFAANFDRADVIKVLIAHGADANAESKVIPIPVIDFRHGNGLAKPVTPKEDPTKVAVEKASSVPGGKTKSDTYSKSEAKEVVSSTGAKLTSGREKKTDVGTEKISDKSADTAEAKIEELRKAARERAAKQMGGLSPLLYAARQGNIAAGVALLENGAKIDEVSGSEHTTPLVLAIANGHLDFAAMLLEHGADAKLANDMGVTPLWAAIDVRWVPREWSPEPIVDQEKVNYLAIMKLLLAHGADPNARLGKQVWSRVLTENRNWVDPAGSTAFWRAAQADDVEAMKLLKDSGADPNIPSKLGTTPLMMAAGLGWSANYHQTAPTRLEAIQYCMSLGADLNAHDDLGYTPLHGAAFVGDLKNIQFMVDHGAKTDAKTKAGDTVADLANGPFEKSLPNAAAVALLEKLGSVNSHNCRSSDCVPPVKEDKPVAVATVPAKKSTE